MERADYYIYKMEIGDYFYFGSSCDKNRIIKHKSCCYNPKQIGHNNKLYTKIRELCPNPLHFYDFVDFTIYHNNLNNELKKYYENFYIQKHKDNEYILNTEKYIFQKGENMKNYYNKKCKKYYQENKNKIMKKKCEKFNCICGGRYTKSHKQEHFQTKKHQTYLSNN